MTQPAGVSATGFLPATQQSILNSIVSAILGSISNSLDVSPVAPLGQLIAIDANQDAQLWELAAVAYNSTNRGAAEGALLDNIGTLTGTPRLPATYSTVYCSCTFTASGTYAAGSLVGFISGISSQTASNLNSVVVPTNNPLNGNVVSLSNPYVTGSSYAAATLFQAPLTGPNFGNALVGANSGNPGNIGAFTGQIPVAGWSAVVDLSTPTIGTNVELDTPYRIRQQQDLGAQGSCNLSAIAVDIVEALQAAPSPVVASCNVYENVFDYIDSNGLLPHSYQVVVYDGLNPNTVQDNPIIGQAIWNNKPAGLRSYGSTNVTVTDSQGVQRTVSFTRPTQEQIYLTVNATISANANLAQVQSLIEVAIIAASQGAQFVAYGATVQPVPGAPTTLLPGVDVVPQAFGGVAQAQAGVIQVTSVLVGTTPSPTQSTQLEIARGSVAVLSQANLVVNLTVFQP